MRQGKMLHAFLLGILVLAGTLPPAAQAAHPSATPAATGASGHAAKMLAPAAASSAAGYSGGRITFVSGRDGRWQIYAMEADGSDQVNLSRNPEWDSSPVQSLDGQAIAFLRCVSGAGTCSGDLSGNLDLWLMDADGGNQRSLLATAYVEGRPSWSPDGTRLATAFLNSGTGKWQLAVVNVATGAMDTPLVESDSDLGWPAWSPDGTRIAFLWHRADQPGIYFVSPSGGEPAYSYLPADPNDSTSYATMPAWSEDGASLAYAVTYPSATRSAIMAGEANGSPDHTPAARQVSPGTALDRHPRWAGGRILYDSNPLSYWDAGSGSLQNYPQVYSTTTTACQDAQSPCDYVALSASGASDLLPDWRPVRGGAPVVNPPYIAYESGDASAQSIVLYDIPTATSKTLLTGSDLRLAGMSGPWVIYQHASWRGGYDLAAYNVRTQERRDLMTPDDRKRNISHPVVEGPNVLWRATTSDTDVTAFFFCHDLSANTTGAINAGSLVQRYSRLTAGGGRLAFIDESYQVRVCDEDGTACSQVAQSPALLCGLSDNQLSAVEFDNQGQRLLVTYTISPTSRSLVASGIQGCPGFDGDRLVWAQDGKLYSQDIVEQLNPEVVSTDASAGAGGGEVTSWLDAGGNWAASQIADLRYSSEAAIEGTVTANLPAGDTQTQSLASQFLAGQAIQAAADLPGNTWLARVVSADSLYRVWRTKNHNIGLFGLAAGDYIYPGWELFTEQYGAAVLQFRDGSSLSVSSGTYLRVQPRHITSAEVVQDIINNTFQAYDVSQFQQAVQRYLTDGNFNGVGSDGQPFGANPTIIANDLTAVKDAARVLSASARSAQWQRYGKNGKKVPTYLTTVSGMLDRVAGQADRLGKITNAVQAMASVFRLINYTWYENGLYDAFRDYFDNVVAYASEDPNTGQVVYRPLEPDSPTYQNRVEVLYKMVLHDGRVCLNERDWQARFYADGSVGLWSAGCGVLNWSRHEVAKHIAAADGQVLRTKLLFPLIQNSLQAYMDVAGMFVPGEAQVILSAMTPNHPVQRWTISRGRMRFSSDIDRMRPRNPSQIKLPGAVVVFWGTAFDITVNDDGSSSIFVSDSMPVVANLGTTSPDAYGITARDGRISLSGAPGTDPLLITGLETRPLLVDLAPNQAMAVSRASFHYQMGFSAPMDTSSVTDNGTLALIDSGGVTRFSSQLGAIPHNWDRLGTSLTLTPTLSPSAGTYTLALTLPDSVVSSVGAPISGGPVFTTTFAVAPVIGMTGGKVTAPSGVSVVVPAGALTADIPLEIGATQAFSVTTGWLPADGVALTLGPHGQTFSRPVTITIPVEPGHAGADIFLWTNGAWQRLNGVLGPDGRSVIATVNHFSIYAAFWPVPAAGFKAHLPMVIRPGAGRTITGGGQ